MIVYHGSIQIVEKPDVLHSDHPLDFGKGFYVTTVLEQAIRWANRKKAIYKGERAVLNIYKQAEINESLRIKDFGDNVSDWIDFVCDCRDEGTDYKQYDLIMGMVANDKVFRVVDMYHQGIWDKERAIKEIKAYKGYDQTAFITQKAIDELLLYESHEVV